MRTPDGGAGGGAAAAGSGSRSAYCSLRVVGSGASRSLLLERRRRSVNGRRHSCSSFRRAFEDSATTRTNLRRRCYLLPLPSTTVTPVSSPPPLCWLPAPDPLGDRSMTPISSSTCGPAAAYPSARRTRSPSPSPRQGARRRVRRLRCAPLRGSARRRPPAGRARRTTRPRGCRCGRTRGSSSMARRIPPDAPPPRIWVGGWVGQARHA